jgi:hypothetical protein
VKERGYSRSIMSMTATLGNVNPQKPLPQGTYSAFTHPFMWITSGAFSLATGLPGPPEACHLATDNKSTDYMGHFECLELEE